MTDTAFCPLYQSVCELEPWNNSTTPHAGLLFNKFANAWGPDPKTTFAFDKGDRSKNERDKKDHEKEGSWLKSFPGRFMSSEKLLAEACQRQRQHVETMGGKTRLLHNASRFVTGLGCEHPLENGFTWHHTLGAPYLPGSSVKGILRAWYRENGPWDDQKKTWKEDEAIKTHFGSHEKDENGKGYGVGRFILLDMLPTAPPKLAVDIMTPHYGPYYQDGKKAPGDWHSPVPIPFLTVEEGQSWQWAVLPGPGHRTVSDDHLEELIKQLIEALAWLGAGAKTAVGYGRFCSAETYKKACSIPTSTGTSQTELQLAKPGDRVQAILLEEKTKKGGWKATHKGSQLSGPIQNTNEVPADKRPGDSVTLIVASVNPKQIAFKYPTEREEKRASKKKATPKKMRRR